MLLLFAIRRIFLLSHNILDIVMHISHNKGFNSILFLTWWRSGLLLQLADEELLPLGHLLVPGLQNSLFLWLIHGQGFRVGLVDVAPRSLHAVGVLQLAAHHAHQKLVERIIVHEVALPPRSVWEGSVLVQAGLAWREQTGFSNTIQLRSNKHLSHLLSQLCCSSSMGKSPYVRPLQCYEQENKNLIKIKQQQKRNNKNEM